MKKIKLKAEKRKLLGRKVKRLRHEDVVPANIYGKKVQSQAVKVNFMDFKKVYETAGETNIVELVLGGKILPVLIHNVQHDPVTDVPIHVDFLKVNLKEKVTAKVPIEMVGESSAVKLGLGTLVQYIDEIEVEALPSNLVDKFEVELTNLEKVDDMVQVKDLKVDEKKIDIKEELDSIIVKIEPLREEEVAVPKAVESEQEEELEEKELEGRVEGKVEEKREEEGKQGGKDEVKDMEKE